MCERSVRAHICPKQYNELISRDRETFQPHRQQPSTDIYIYIYTHVCAVLAASFDDEEHV